MAKSFNSSSTAAAAGGSKARNRWRIVLGLLVAANLAAAAFVLYPPGGSADDLERQMAELQSRVKANRALLVSTRQHVAAVEKGRAEGDKFLDSYFLARRTAYSSLLTELVEAADRSKIKPKEHAYATEPIEGSDALSMMTISANYEGTYANLMHFVHEIDKSPRMLIIEGLSAAPLQTGGTLSVSMKIDAFVREDGSQGSGAEQ
jgi:Tfp pilus assembly protein PilO